MTFKRKVILTIGLVVAAIVLIIWYVHSHEPNDDPAIHYSEDSLRVTKPIYDSTRIASIKAETVYVQRAAQSEAHSDTLVRVANAQHHIADSLTAVAKSAGDTNTVLWQALNERTVEVVTLRASNDSLRSANVDLRSARIIADTRDTTAQTRLNATTDLNARVAKAIDDSGCRIVWRISCPSRKEVLVAGMLVGLFHSQITDQAKKLITP